VAVPVAIGQSDEDVKGVAGEGEGSHGATIANFAIARKGVDKGTSCLLLPRRAAPSICPAGSSTHPGVGSTYPGGSSTYPGVDSTCPGGSSAYPGVGSTYPGGSSTLLGADSTPPGGSSIETRAASFRSRAD